MEVGTSLEIRLEYPNQSQTLRVCVCGKNCEPSFVPPPKKPKQPKQWILPAKLCLWSLLGFYALNRIRVCLYLRSIYQGSRTALLALYVIDTRMVGIKKAMEEKKNKTLLPLLGGHLDKYRKVHTLYY
jgi:hypothetical protein